jgi:hypothetical protein
MAFLIDNVYDSGLSYITSNGTRIDICSQEPTTYTQATSTYTLGNKASMTVGSPTNGATDGRKVVVPAITDGSVTASGTASHWALTNASNTLIATGSLTSSQSVTNGNTFTLDAIDITIRDATSV